MKKALTVIMKARGKGILFIAVVISFIVGSPLLADSIGSAYADQSTYTVSGTINPVSELSSVYFVGMYSHDSVSNYFARKIFWNVNANELTSFSFDIDLDGNAPAAYTILAAHSSDTYDGITVGSNTIELGKSWDESWPSGYSQIPFYNMLTTGSAIELLLGNLYRDKTAYLGAAMGSSLRLVNFSIGSDGGYAFASNTSAVPEPATMLLFGVGLLGLAGVRRKLKK